MNIKKGDKLLCKKTYKSYFYGKTLCLCGVSYEVLNVKGRAYLISDPTVPMGTTGVTIIMCEYNTEYVFTLKDIETYFYNPSEVRKMKLEKLEHD